MLSTGDERAIAIMAAILRTVTNEDGTCVWSHHEAIEYAMALFKDVQEALEKVV
jgi:hypothetical protein